MHLLNRVLAIVMGLLLIMLVTVVLLVPESLVLLLSGFIDVDFLLRLAVVVVVNVLILVFMYFQLRRPQKSSTTGLAVKASGAATDISVESARTMILNGVQSVKDVVSADVDVKAVQGRADVDLNVRVTGDDIHIPNKQKEIDRALRQVINKQLGLQMRGKPRVHISLQGEKPETPVLEAKQPASTPAKASSPAPEKAVDKSVVADEDDDTLMKSDDKPKPLLGLRRHDEPEPEKKADNESNDWLSSYDKQKAENEQN